MAQSGPSVVIEYAPLSLGHGLMVPLLDTPLPDELALLLLLLEVLCPPLPEVEPCAIPPVPPPPVPAVKALEQATGSAASKEKTTHRRMVSLRMWTVE
jgi:hypothetical protein